jgi:uncharacterized membrane protein YhaH (DUF805 family)|tara:strand:- start:484 stop:885 length:402 start_codon:yes stop_codon:yes gene_type:complete
MMEEPEITGRPADTMTFMDATKTCFRKSLTISGRASRSELWFYYLASVLGMIGLGLIDGLLGGIGITLLVLAFFPGLLTASIRRMHDIGKSGWMMLLFVIPLVGLVLNIMWFMVDAGQPHANQYGDVPTNTLE